MAIIKPACSTFGRDKSVISRHLTNIFKTKELNKNSVVANFATTASDGKTYQVDYYNLDAIISVDTELILCKLHSLDSGQLMY